MANYDDFTVFIYDNEFAYLQWLVLQKPTIETGGDLFGLWQSKDTAVVQFLLGPGRNCTRTTVSFHQDVEYLESVGQYLTTRQGLCNIGEWHSHHRIGLTSPSGGDENTVWKHMPSVSGGRFLLFIANIEDSETVKVGCFVFNSNTNKMTRGRLIQLLGCSPLRHSLDYKNELKQGSEVKQDWDTFCDSRRDRRRCLWPSREMKSVCVCEIKGQPTNNNTSLYTAIIEYCFDFGIVSFVAGILFRYFGGFRIGFAWDLPVWYRSCAHFCSWLVAKLRRIISRFGL